MIDATQRPAAESARARATGPLAVPTSEPVASTHRAGRRRFDLRVDRLSGVYVALILLIVYCVTDSTFRTVSNLRVVASSQAITGILALGLIVSLVCGVFDISIAANMSLAITLV